MNELVNGKTAVFALIGNPVEHSYSPQLHNTLSEKMNLNAVYVPFRVERDELQHAVKGLKALNVAGFNVTVPHKKDVIKYLDEVSKESLLMGAVNTVKNIGGLFYGYNTDAEGFVRAFEEETGERFADKNVVILGAGGSTRSIAIKLAILGVKSLYILNRTLENAVQLADMIRDNVRPVAYAKALSSESMKEVAGFCDILINTTTLGMYPGIENCPVEDGEVFKNKPIVYDIIANPSKTKLLQMAEKNGCKIINGIGMLYYQGIFAYEIWTGMKVPQDLVQTHKEHFFSYFNT